MTTTKTDDPQETIKRLRRQLDQARAELDEVKENVDAEIAAREEPLDGMRAALVSLHEQAHGNTSIKFCHVEPCRTLEVAYAGPAPLALIP